MKKLKSKVLKLLSILLVLTLVLVPFTTNVDAATSTKTSSLPIYCYSRYGGTNVQVYTKTSTSSAKQGIIIPSDYIKILDMNTSGWAKVNYPTKQGRKTGYCLSQCLFENIKFSDKWGYLKGAKQNAYAVYKKYDVKSKLDIIAGDTSVKITGIHQNGNTQILYAKSGGGYYLGWIKGKWSLTSTKPNISTKITNLPVYCYSLYGGTNVQVYTKTSTSSAKQGIIIPSDYITILDTNTSGWAKVKYPTKQGYKTGYCLLKDLLINIKFVNQSGYLKAAQPSYKVYKKYDLKSELGTISGYAKVKITGIHKNGNTQILYTISSGKFGLGWIKGKHSLTSTKPKIPTSKVDKVISLAKDQLGKPYVKGGNGPNSFDCSGLTKYVYKKAAGITLPRRAIDQSGYGTTVSKSNLKKGDLIFFDTKGSNNGVVSHVGIYVGNGEMIHAPKPGDVVKKVKLNFNKSGSYWNTKYVRAKRVL